MKRRLMPFWLQIYAFSTFLLLLSMIFAFSLETIKPARVGIVVNNWSKN